MRMPYYVIYNSLPLLYSGILDPIAADPVRLALWTAACEGDDVAKAALLDWYKDHGVDEYISPIKQEQ